MADLSTRSTADVDLLTGAQNCGLTADRKFRLQKPLSSPPPRSIRPTKPTHPPAVPRTITVHPGRRSPTNQFCMIVGEHLMAGQ